MGRELFALDYSKIRKAALVYVSLPVLGFTFLYMDSLWGVLLGILCVISLVALLAGNGSLIRAFNAMRASKAGRADRKKEDETDGKKTDKNETDKGETKAAADGAAGGAVKITLGMFTVIILIALVWCFFGGIGGHWAQSSDWDARNAIFRDMIMRDWPVTYRKFDKALVYYIGHWIIPAAVTKTIGKVFPALYEDPDVAFAFGDQMLWLFTAAGVVCAFLLLLCFTGADTARKQVKCMLIMILFSGLDIVGVCYGVYDWGLSTGGFLHIEWWAQSMQFSSLTTCLFWVFNQAVIPWIVVLMLMQEKDVSAYVHLGVCALMAGPLPLLSIFIYMLITAFDRFFDLIGNKKWKPLFTQVFSASNLIMLVLIPVIWFYYSSNSAVGGGAQAAADAQGIVLFGFLRLLPVSFEYFRHVLWFLLLEVGIYLIFVFPFYKKNAFFWATVVTSAMAPFFSVGLGADFIMRFSIPSIMVLCAMSARVILMPESFGEGKTASRFGKWFVRIAPAALTVAFFLGAVTPATEFGRGYVTMLATGVFANPVDNLETLNQDIADYNFVAYGYGESIFFKYLTQKQ